MIGKLKKGEKEVKPKPKTKKDQEHIGIKIDIKK